MTLGIQLYSNRTYNYNIIYFIPYYITIIKSLFYVWNICLIISIDSIDCIDCIDSIDCIDYIEWVRATKIMGMVDFGYPKDIRETKRKC